MSQEITTTTYITKEREFKATNGDFYVYVKRSRNSDGGRSIELDINGESASLYGVEYEHNARLVSEVLGKACDYLCEIDDKDLED